MFWHHLKIAWRNLLKYKISAGIGVMGLAVGLVCFVLCMYSARLLMGIDEAFPNHKRIAEVALKDPVKKYYFSGSPAHTVNVLANQFPGKTESFTRVTYPWKFNAAFEINIP